MRRIAALISAFILCFAIAPVFCLKADAAADISKGWDGDVSKSRIQNTRELFSSEEIETLTEEIQKTAEYLEMNIFICLSDTPMSKESVEIYSDDRYDEIFGEDTDGVFYTLDLSGQSPAHDFISTSGKAVLLYQSHIDAIFSYLDNYLPPSGQGDYSLYKDDIYQAIEEFLGKLEYYSDSFESGDATNYYYDSSSGKYFYYKDGQFMESKGKPPTVKLMILAVAAVIGAATAIIVYFAIKSHYKFKSSANPSVYVSGEETRLSVKTDTFIRSYTTKVHISSDSGGSHGGGGHSHSGGHGGGGHSR